jgi:stage III sporulation protein AF
MQYLIEISAIVVLSIILKFLIPNGNIKKFTTWIISVIISVLMINPVFSFIKSGDFSFDSSKITIQQDFIESTFNKKVENNKKIFINAIKDKISNINIDVDYEILDNKLIYKKIHIDLKNAVLYTDKEHIDIINEIKLTAKNIFGNDVEIDIYG